VLRVCVCVVCVCVLCVLCVVCVCVCVVCIVRVVCVCLCCVGGVGRPSCNCWQKPKIEEKRPSINAKETSTEEKEP
jgi:hypothetical protein